MCNIRRTLIAISILGNLIFVTYFMLQKFNEPTYKLGILTENIKVGIFNQPGLIFELPKGLTVMDVAPSGIASTGQFENYRFSIVVTSNNPHLVDYNAQESEFNKHSNYYSENYMGK